MRILFCNFEYPPLGGGGGTINALLAQELARRHEVTVLTSRALGLAPESVEGGVRIIRAPVFLRRQQAVANVSSMLTFIFSGLRTGKKLLATEEYDIINTHFVLPSGPVGDALSRFSGIPNILTVHGGDLYDPSKSLSPHQYLPLRLWIRSLLRRSDIVIGQSTNTLDNMRRYYAPEIQGVQIPLGIRKPPVLPVSRHAYGFADDEVLLVTVGRLVARKAVDQLIQASEILKAEKIRLLIIGSGPQESLLRKQCLERKLEDRVRFMGQLSEEEKFRCLRMCDIYVSTSQHEGFGLVFLEAMACGLPVICYDQGGQRDFLEDKLTGYVLSLNDLTQFVSACRQLAHDSSLRQKIGQENVRRAERFFIEACAHRYEDVFDEAIMRSRVKALVNLSGAKKLPLSAAESMLIGRTNGHSVGALFSSRSTEPEKAKIREEAIVGLSSH